MRTRSRQRSTGRRVRPKDRPSSSTSGRFDRLEIEVVDTNFGNPRLNGNANAIGFAEVRLVDSASGAPVRVHEVVQMPTDLLDAVGEESTAQPLVVLMTRDRIRPVPPRSDPERAIARAFTLPADA